MYTHTHLLLQRRMIESSIQDLRTKWKVKDTQSFLTLCNPMDCTVHEILQAKMVEGVTYPFSSRSSWPRNQTGVFFIAGGFFTNWTIREALTKVDTIKVVDTIIWVDNIRIVNTMEKVKVKSLSVVWLFATPWTVAHQAPPSMEFPGQEYWSGLPFGLKRR